MHLNMATWPLLGFQSREMGFLWSPPWPSSQIFWQSQRYNHHFYLTSLICLFSPCSRHLAGVQVGVSLQFTHAVFLRPHAQVWRLVNAAWGPLKMLLMMRLVCWSLFTVYVSLLPAQACCSTQIRAADGGSVVEQLGGSSLAASPAWLCVMRVLGWEIVFLGEAEKQWRSPALWFPWFGQWDCSSNKLLMALAESRDLIERFELGLNFDESDPAVYTVHWGGKRALGKQSSPSRADFCDNRQSWLRQQWQKVKLKKTCRLISWNFVLPGVRLHNLPWKRGTKT